MTIVYRADEAPVKGNADAPWAPGREAGYPSGPHEGRGRSVFVPEGAEESSSPAGKRSGGEEVEVSGAPAAEAGNGGARRHHGRAIRLHRQEDLSPTLFVLE